MKYPKLANLLAAPSPMRDRVPTVAAAAATGLAFAAWVTISQARMGAGETATTAGSVVGFKAAAAISTAAGKGCASAWAITRASSTALKISAGTKAICVLFVGMGAQVMAAGLSDVYESDAYEPVSDVPVAGESVAGEFVAGEFVAGAVAAGAVAAGVLAAGEFGLP